MSALTTIIHRNSGWWMFCAGDFLPPLETLVATNTIEVSHSKHLLFTQHYSSSRRLLFICTSYYCAHYQIWSSLINGSSNPSSFSTTSLLLRLAFKLHRAAANQNTVAEMKQFAPVDSSHWSLNKISFINCPRSTLLLHRLLSKISSVKPEKRLRRRRHTPTNTCGRPTFSLNPMHAEKALRKKNRNPPISTIASNARAAFHFESMTTLSEYPKQPAYHQTCSPLVARIHWAYRHTPKWSVKDWLIAVNFKKSHLILPIKVRRKAVAPKTSAPKLNVSQLRKRERRHDYLWAYAITWRL